MIEEAAPEDRLALRKAFAELYRETGAMYFEHYRA
jgi:hypothetical protein